MSIGMTTEPTLDYEVIVIGAGFAGLRALHHLRGEGYSIRCLEAGDDVGGTWYWNRYPGARVDAESLEYSYAFDEDLQQEWEWKERYAGQPEVLDYLRHVADRFDLRKDIEFGGRVSAISFDEEAVTWTISTEDGESLSCRYVVSAVGFLSSPYTPEIPGLETYEGELVHTGRWPHEKVEFVGKRVGIIGAGATTIQMTPIIAQAADTLTVFQRSPMWIVPLQNMPMPAEYQARIKSQYAELRRREFEESFAGCSLVDFEMRAGETRSALEVTPEEREAEYEFRWQSGGLCFYTTFPDLMFNIEANNTLRDFLASKVRSIVKDPVVADLLIPKDHPPLTKRICGESGYFEAFNRDDVSLVDTKADAIVEITPKGLRLASGAEYEVDMLIFATGFDAGTGPLLNMNVTGRDGINLKEAWSEGARTHLGLMTAGFPNLFMLDGPQSNAAFFAPPLFSDYQSQFLARVFERMANDGVSTIEPRPEAAAGWSEIVDAVANSTLLPMANSWWLARNIPGKPQQSLYFLGGFPEYRRRCELVLDEGFQEFHLVKSAATAV